MIEGGDTVKFKCQKSINMSKKKLLADIFEVVEHARESAEQHQEEVESLRNFYKYAKEMVKSEAPEFEEKFAEIMSHFNKAVQLEEELVAAEKRTAEDINDVAARFDVVFRVSEETIEKTAAVKRCSANIRTLREKLQADLANGGTKQHKIEAEIQTAVEAKKAAIQAADVKLQEFIKVKETYNTFKVRRFQHAYTSYGECLSRVMKELSNVYSQLSSECNISDEQLDKLLEQGVTVAPTEETKE